MADRPIIFSGAMVRALLEGRKTMTRRLLKPQPEWDNLEALWKWKDYAWGYGSKSIVIDDHSGKLPYYTGDRLYVRENWCEFPEDAPDGQGGLIYYQASQPEWQKDVTAKTMERNGVKWRPSIHLPKTHSRITLTVTAVKIERLQDISEQDAKAEGMLEWAYTDVDGDPRLDGKAYMCMGYHWEQQKSEWDGFSSAKGAFEALWQSLNAKRAPWESNPWVVAPVFTVHKCNIDQLPKESDHADHHQE